MALLVTTIGQFMALLDTNNINIALPSDAQRIRRQSKPALVVASYVMALAIVIPLSGFLGERIGMKRLYMFTLGGFVLGSALCGLAWNAPSLICFRIIQGLFGGMLQPLGMALVFTMITPMERRSTSPSSACPTSSRQSSDRPSAASSSSTSAGASSSSSTCR